MCCFVKSILYIVNTVSVKNGTLFLSSPTVCKVVVSLWAKYLIILKFLICSCAFSVSLLEMTSVIMLLING